MQLHSHHPRITGLLQQHNLGHNRSLINLLHLPHRDLLRLHQDFINLQPSLTTVNPRTPQAIRITSLNFRLKHSHSHRLYNKDLDQVICLYNLTNHSNNNTADLLNSSNPNLRDLTLTISNLKTMLRLIVLNPNLNNNIISPSHSNKWTTRLHSLDVLQLCFVFQKIIVTLLVSLIKMPGFLVLKKHIALP